MLRNKENEIVTSLLCCQVVNNLVHSLEKEAVKPPVPTKRGNRKEVSR